MIKKLLKLDPRWYVAMAIILQMLLAWRLQGPAVLKHTLSICLIACGLDFIMIFLTKRRAAFPLSAFVSGLIISALLAPGRLFYLAPLVAVFSKYLIRIRARHIFNPAAFGLLVVNVFWGMPLIWWFDRSWPITLIFGLFAADRVRKLSIVFSFVSAAFVFSVIYSAIKHQPLMSNLGIINLFFVFFMLIEPKTSPARLKGKLIYAAAVALFALLAVSFSLRYDPLVMSLIAGNVINALILRKAG